MRERSERYNPNRVRSRLDNELYYYNRRRAQENKGKKSIVSNISGRIIDFIGNENVNSLVGGVKGKFWRMMEFQKIKLFR